jgi:hypothetical protein
MPRDYPTPTYRNRKGYSQAIVTLTDSKSGKRRDYWLGQQGTPESREAYHRLIADWEARDRRWPDRPNNAPQSAEPPAHDDVNAARLLKTYWAFAKRYYGREESANFKAALRLLRQHHGTTPVTAFGPSKLRRLRDGMIRGDASADPPRIPWARTTINRHWIVISEHDGTPGPLTAAQVRKASPVCA